MEVNAKTEYDVSQTNDVSILREIEPLTDDFFDLLFESELEARKIIGKKTRVFDVIVLDGYTDYGKSQYKAKTKLSVILDYYKNHYKKDIVYNEPSKAKTPEDLIKNDFYKTYINFDEEAPRKPIKSHQLQYKKELQERKKFKTLGILSLIMIFISPIFLIVGLEINNGFLTFLGVLFLILACLSPIFFYTYFKKGKEIMKKPLYDEDGKEVTDKNKYVICTTNSQLYSENSAYDDKIKKYYSRYEKKYNVYYDKILEQNKLIKPIVENLEKKFTELLELINLLSFDFDLSLIYHSRELSNYLADGEKPSLAIRLILKDINEEKIKEELEDKIMYAIKKATI